MEYGIFLDLFRKDMLQLDGCSGDTTRHVKV